MEDTYGIQSRIGSIIVVERWYCCRGSPVFSDRNIQLTNLILSKRLFAQYNRLASINTFFIHFQFLFNLINKRPHTAICTLTQFKFINNTFPLLCN